jgi:hypothetical protein
MKLKEGYSRAKCCRPDHGDQIKGYYSHNMIMIVHKVSCTNLCKVDSERLVDLIWEDIAAAPEFEPAADYDKLDALDWRIMRHHRKMGVDYSHVVARILHVKRDDVFQRHDKLRSLKLLERVKPVMMQYRKGIVDNKWIKHRNHTYYDLTEKGRKYLEYHDNNRRK